MASSFGHNAHHQEISQKIKKAGTYIAKSTIYYLLINIIYYINWNNLL